MITEFNWYIVLKDETEETLPNMQMGKTYQFTKEDYRIYPMDIPLPLIYNGKCLSLVSIKHLNWKDNCTFLSVEPILLLQKDDPIREYYESHFSTYQQEQQRVDDGGKVDLRGMVNPLTRIRIPT